MSAAGKGKILLIEDDSALRSVYADAIAADGYTVVTAEDGEQGWALVRTEKPDVVLLDLILPKLPGFEVLKNIRANAGTSDTIVLIMSVMGEHRHIEKAMELGANDYTVKGSSTPREVLGKIEALLTKRLIKEHIPDAKEQVKVYNLFILKNRGDADKLQNDAGSTMVFTCPDCREEMQLVLAPDHSRSDAHWFSAHFACPNCGKPF
ncbi:MAG: response regulator transcription factor [Dehalococcoidia bacterium]|jgi:DNA-binding response OmpR family regulator